MLDINIPMKQHGFTLVEMAVVIVIMGLLLGGMLLPLSTQLDVEGNRKTNAELSEIKETLMGFAAINGRLPCPASSTSNGVEDPVGGGNCAHPYDGFLPAATLGFSPSDGQGYAIDGWGNTTSNRIRYALSTSGTNAFSTALNLSLAGDLKVCADAACTTTLSNSAVAVIFSSGKNANQGTLSTDETENVDNDSTFVNHDTTSDYDDQMVWISFPLLANRMITAGKLP